VATNWMAVPPVEGAFVVNIGDMLERWTNGRLPSTLHRVVNTSGRERFSLALFFEPNGDCAVSPIGAAGEALKYARVERYGEWLLAKFDATGGG
jgi:isopenicillin N synthase-like dioxygenase